MYSSYKDVPQENFAEVLLRTGKLAEAKTEGKTQFPATEGKHAEKAHTHTHTQILAQIETYCGLVPDAREMQMLGYLIKIGSPRLILESD